MDDLLSQTQPSTQQRFDPRRLGRNNSGLSTEDISDVICILHPCSPAAFTIVANTALRKPEHVLQNDRIDDYVDEGKSVDLEEQETFIMDSEVVDNAQDLALRFSSEPVQPVMGFCFGRNPRSCDIVIDTDSFKRVSNLHFRIFINPQGVLMLEDMSTNGTLVDEIHLKGKSARGQATRMLQAGSIIQIPSTKKEEGLKFIVRIPSRGGFEMEYADNVRRYLNKMRVLEDQEKKKYGHVRHPHTTGVTQMATDLHLTSNPFGMRWDGGDKYNVVGHLGKGAFATVYKLATKLDGQHYAAKELDKRRFMKNGRLDQRLDNEMQIMKSIRHENIVQYMGYQDQAAHLYIIMEYVPCGDLQGYLLANKRLPEPEGKEMSRQVLDALHYLHGKKITHRDIKPDNILIASYDPFVIKLSDFGLSKIVSTDQTFLKTFCGTLLYCAPEVFPHYEDHMARKGVKRRRSGNAFAPKFHSYSQSVDIWSYAAVLWLAMCEKPPFEGVVDQTGKGMFDKIMETRLDIQPLLAYGISTPAIDLLCRMLNTDPAKRPNEIECLRHPWLYDGRRLSNSSSQAANGLLPISEEGAEGAPTVGEQAQRLSQLSVQDSNPAGAGARRQLSNVEEEPEFDDSELGVLNEFDSGDLDFIDPRQSKRVRASHVPRHEAGARAGQAAIPSSSPELSDDEEFDLDRIGQPDLGFDLDGSPTLGRAELRPNPTPRLFGEIGDSALESSGMLGDKTAAALDLPSDEAQADSQQAQQSRVSNMSLDGARSEASYQAGQLTSELHRSDQGLYPSLMGTESEMREMHMADVPSHELPNSQDASDYVDEPQTPKTPDFTPSEEENSCNTKSPISQHTKNSANATPRPDKRIHQNGITQIPSSHPSAGLEPSQKPILGRLVTTPDSYLQLNYPLYDRMSHYGRHPKNTFVHPHVMDVKVPKRAFIIWFHAYGIEKVEKEGRDWRLMPDLHTVINHKLRPGTFIAVNGVRLFANNEQGETLCGRLYNGDLIEVFTTQNRESGSQRTLKFVCEFFVGEAERTRPEEAPPFVVETDRLEAERVESSF